MGLGVSGFAVLYREATEHHLFMGDSARFGAWTWLVLKACWKPTKFNAGGTTITVERGQLCVSRSQLAAAWGWSPSAVERFLTRLQTEQMIERATGQGRSVITICNYDKYQDISDDAGQATGQGTGQRPDSDRTTKEQGNHGTIVDEEANASPSTARKRAKFVLPDWVPKDHWEAFVAMRNRIRKPMTDEAKRLAVGELAKLAEDGHPPGDVLNQSIFKSYSGLFPIKDRQNGHPGNNRNQSGSSTIDAVRRAIELTGGAEERDSARPAGGDSRVGAMPHPMRSIGHVQ